MRRLFVILVGLAASIAAGVVFLVVAGLFVPATRELAADFSLGGMLALFAALVSSDAPDRVWSAVALAFWTVATALVVLPPVLAAIIGEVAGLRSFVWYSGAAGLLTAAIAWLGHAASHGPDSAETKLLLLLFLTGAVAGWVYWAIAGKMAGAARSPAA
ncbi:hypothetical protein NK718_14765 [Alsobacter sp. SYSU M60028]|uniref:DUF4175 domain-containing protein n=1 Tax=Alsobacter ponti TaxID=2962936 RepID=A0ABT1LFW6_9HYPH|nr:hypothetical protein [Alsobacter ponti]MCP8939788.1 hypothetical protein [Alsobacter ponti]